MLYRVCFVENRVDLVWKFEIHHSLNRLARTPSAPTP